MENEFKGTKGPWKVNVIGQHWNNPSLTHLEVTFGDDGECVCDTVYQMDDAQLISAAPELLEALQIICFFEDISDAQRQIAEKAIAKALGETK